MRCRMWQWAAPIVVAACVSPAAMARNIVVGAGEGGAPQVHGYNGLPSSLSQSFLAYGPGFSGGVRVAVGDVDGDSLPDIVTGSGPGASHVKAFSGATGAEIRSFLAFGPFAGGVHVAAGDMNDDGVADIIVGAGQGISQVKVFDGAKGDEFISFLAFSFAATGVTVAAGDVNNDDVPDIITGATALAPHVKVFDGLSGSETRSFFAFPGFNGGVSVAAGDVNGDGFSDIITGAGSGASGGHVKVFDGMTGAESQSFFAFPGFSGGVTVAAGDLNGDGLADIITGMGPPDSGRAGPGPGPNVKVFSGADLSLLDSFFAFSPDFTGGVFVAAVPSPISAVPLGLIAAAWLRRRRN